ncbi:MAG: DUF309 domain-containing protein [Thermodesulfobacteriota bacterium]
MKKFDPFNNRLARDIRNGLSKSFIGALAERDVSLFKKRAAEYLKQDLEQVYQMYIETRLGKYDEVFVAIEQGRIDDKLQQAEILWEQELYFEMHELLENIWNSAEGDERKALQGLIRAAGMKIHAENGNTRAAVTMGRKAQAALQNYGRLLIHFTKLESILAEIANTLANMDSSS